MAWAPSQALSFTLLTCKWLSSPTRDRGQLRYTQEETGEGVVMTLGAHTLHTHTHSHA